MGKGHKNTRRAAGTRQKQAGRAISKNEGKASPVTGAPSHVLSQHVARSDADLKARFRNPRKGDKKTAFADQRAASAALKAALNSREGQQAVDELSGKRGRQTVRASVSGGSMKAREMECTDDDRRDPKFEGRTGQVREVTVVLDSDGKGKITAQTIYPSRIH